MSSYLVGVALLFGVARMIPPQHAYGVGWIGMFGIVLILHFGTFHLLSCTWRYWIVGEALAVLLLLVASLGAIPWTIAPVTYAALMILGSWLFPFITSFIPHNPTGDTELTQTRLFRGRIVSIVALEHLYHLEHHLYPQVPHHNWPELGRRLDPYFARAGVQPLRLFF